MPYSSADQPDLAAIQRELLDDFTQRRPLDAASRASRFKAPPRGTLEHRWAVFSAGYLTRLIEAIGNDYPAVRRILGDRPFGSLVKRYVTACPPRGYDIGQAGDRLAGFVGDDPLATEMPFVADLARLEWALAGAFVAADQPALDLDVVGAIDPVQLVGRPLHLVAGAVVIRSRWPLVQLWHCKDLTDHDISVDLEGPPTRTLVWRSGPALRCRAADEIEARIVELAAAGRSLSTVVMPDGTTPTELVVGFRNLVAEGLFQAFSEPAQPAQP